ncbi:MAG: BON domain-containing protein [Phenylobacterium sp.]|nr:MAG: BON domain-containing protein [Phenylobacterium sp.]
MPRFDSRGRDDGPRGDGPDREDFGQADYSSDYGYDPAARSGYRADRVERRDDFGQADYSRDYGYDPDTGPYRRFSEEDPNVRPAETEREPRSWFGGARRREGPSDRVLWTVIAERLKAQRGLDLHDVEVRVDDGEVTLNGTVRNKEDKRRIEDVSDVRGVRHVQNNLRVRDRGRWTFL